MAKKILFVGLAVIILCLCCGVCFAAEGNNDSINLGNQIMESIDKTGESFNNVVSGNTMNNAGNMVKDGVNNVRGGAEDAGNAVVNRDGNYNAIRTTTEGTMSNNNGFTMTTTTWMWIILVVAAVIIIAAIWYYATQNNS